MNIATFMPIRIFVISSGSLADQNRARVFRSGWEALAHSRQWLPTLGLDETVGARRLAAARAPPARLTSRDVGSRPSRNRPGRRRPPVVRPASVGGR